MDKYQTVIGLEVHAELQTKTKIFCSCPTGFGGEPNTRCCPVCMGLPGSLPVVNRKVIEYCSMAGFATHCSISGFTKQDRKNYFYPDIPKGYQISQYDLPVCKDGYILIDTKSGEKKIRIIRIHIEEDAGKLVHDTDSSFSMADYNRAGVPLIEIVTMPDLSDADEALEFLGKLKAILEFTGVSDCKMQEGSLRADVNVSVKLAESDVLGTRTETKNLNSFRSIYNAIVYERDRQIKELEAGRKIFQQTRHYDDTKGITYAMRSKEEAHDYRYFPEPDLPPVVFTDEWLNEIKNSVPVLPEKRKHYYMTEYGLSDYDSGILTSSKGISDFFEEALRWGSSPKSLANWIMGDMLKIINERNLEFDGIPFPAEYLTRLVCLTEEGNITPSTGKKVFMMLFDRPEDPSEIILKEGLAVMKVDDEFSAIIREVINDNPSSVKDYLDGKKKAFGYLMGRVMAKTQGRADPEAARRLLLELLEK